MSLRRTPGLAAAAAVAILLVGCAKGPAKAALETADRAIEAARPKLEKYARDELQSLRLYAGAAHERFRQGDYQTALAAAQEIPARVEAALEAARKKQARSP